MSLQYIPTTVLMEIECLPKISLQLIPFILQIKEAPYTLFKIQLGEEVNYLYNFNNKLNI